MTTPPPAFESAPMTSVETYMYGLKRRAQEHHCLVHGTFPVELTALLALRRRYSEAHGPVALLPFFIKAVALAVKETPGVNRILFKRFPLGRRIVRFNTVDVNLPITRKVGDETITFIGTLRQADTMTIAQIRDALEALQKGPPEQSPYIQKLLKLKRAPPWVATLFHWWMTWSPRFYLRNAGTCSLTTLDGMRGEHLFSTGPTTTLFCLGGMGDEPVVRDGEIVVRHMLKAALALDNYVISGLDGVLVARRFQTLIEAADFAAAELPALPPSPSTSPPMNTPTNDRDVMRQQLIEQIAQRARLPPSEVRTDAHLVTELGLSSVDLLSVLAFCEQTFAVAIPDAMLSSLVTVDKIEAAIAQFTPTR